MAKYCIRAANRDTGETAELTVEAENQHDAVRRVVKQGYLVADCRPAESTPVSSPFVVHRSPPAARKALADAKEESGLVKRRRRLFGVVGKVLLVSVVAFAAGFWARGFSLPPDPTEVLAQRTRDDEPATLNTDARENRDGEHQVQAEIARLREQLAQKDERIRGMESSSVTQHDVPLEAEQQQVSPPQASTIDPSELQAFAERLVPLLEAKALELEQGNRRRDDGGEIELDCELVSVDVQRTDSLLTPVIGVITYKERFSYTNKGMLFMIVRDVRHTLRFKRDAGTWFSLGGEARVEHWQTIPDQGGSSILGRVTSLSPSWAKEEIDAAQQKQE